jgi:cobalt-zinc-cadmium efflux system membrane fusion protein
MPQYQHHQAVWKGALAVVLFLSASAFGFWATGSAKLPPFAALFAHAAATATEALPAEGDKCTEPCCAGKTDGGTTAAGASAECGDACCPKTPEAAESAKEPCCPKCAAKAAGAAQTGIQEGATAATAQLTVPTAPENAPSSLSPPLSASAWTADLIQRFKAAGDWCTEHGVPESMCVKCNPALAADFKAKGNWCGSHEVPESLCSICHKQLAKLGIGRDWCEAHGVPASQCVICAPEHAVRTGAEAPSLFEKVEVQAAALEAEAAKRDFEKALGSEGAPYEEARRNGINPNCPLHGIKIRFESPKVAEEAGLVVETVGRRRMTQSIDCYGDIQYDQSHYAFLSPRAPGIVNSVKAAIGQQVWAGDILAVIDSTEFGKAKAGFLRAHAAANKWKWVSDSYQSTGNGGAVSRKELVEAQAELEAAGIELAIARQTLKNFNLKEAEIDQVAADKDTSTLLPVRAPFAATVVQLSAVPGEQVETGAKLFALADLSTMWVCLDLFVEDLNQVAIGMPVAFTVDRMKGETFVGKITWISSDLDPKTRTGKVRAELDNSENLLRAGLFGEGKITIHDGEEVVTVPREAVQWDGCCNVVFVQQDGRDYEARKLRLGYETEGFYTVMAGLLPGEQVVTQGSYLMKTEILKSKIGAGCCANDSPKKQAGQAGGTEGHDHLAEAAH